MTWFLQILTVSVSLLECIVRYKITSFEITKKLEPIKQFHCHIRVQHIKIDKNWLISFQ